MAQHWPSLPSLKQKSCFQGLGWGRGGMEDRAECSPQPAGCCWKQQLFCLCQESRVQQAAVSLRLDPATSEACARPLERALVSSPPPVPQFSRDNESCCERARDCESWTQLYHRLHIGCMGAWSLVLAHPQLCSCTLCVQSFFFF